ncbi:hypothetical protein GGR53DRAFT_43025 [Hypoxylon sp. FL1150]|nr:hypothetical protein GGR53DRAFT_43025 [Hypoxylon sp. FL1150]
MNPQNFSVDSVESDRLNPHSRASISPSDLSEPTTSQVTVLHDPRQYSAHEQSTYGDSPSPVSQHTAVPYAPTPPPAPTPPSLSSESESEIYGPERLFGYQQPPMHEDVGRSLISPSPSPGVHFHQPQFNPMAATQELAFSNQFKDDLARAAGVVTPGVDDGPYIRYALDAITRVPDDGRGLRYPSTDSDESYHPAHHAYHFTPTAVPSPLRPSAAFLPRDTTQFSPPQAWPLGPSPAPNPMTPPRSAEDEFRDTRQQRRDRDEMIRLLSEPWGTPQPLRQLLGRCKEGPRDEIPITPPAESIFNPISENRRGLAPPLPVLEKPPTPSEDRAGDYEPRNREQWQPQSDMVTDPKMLLHNVENALHLASPLTRKPWVLRSQSLLLMATLCLLMITALIFSAVFSESHIGLTPYSGTIYGGQYFLFRILPQLMAAFILIYAQCIINAAFWVLPFSSMASDDRNERRDAVFLPLYPKSFLWPQLYGSWYIWIPIFNVWLLNFTIPLQSCLFTVILVDGRWTWATVQGIAWTLVAIYLSFALSLGVMFVFWHKRRTGMQQNWIIRTLADIIFLVSQSNSLAQYRGLEKMSTRTSMKQKLVGTAERLGFWFSPDVPERGSWYGIGNATGKESAAAEKVEGQGWAGRQQKEEDLEAGKGASSRVRYRYIPWCFRDSKIIFFTVVSGILLIALFVVSFLPSTDVRKGFLPLLSSGPTAGAFSPADFLYAFIPSLIGLVLFLLFQPLDLTLRILTPWGELARAEGSRAETSLLLDYSVCLPFESTYKAIRNKHWRVAYVSLMAPLFVLLPVLGGGLFMALTPSDGVVRMYPNVPAFAVILTLLVLYVAGLVCLVPFRWQFRLPHAVTCLAEIISFCCNEQVRTDEAFDTGLMLRPRHLAGRLDIGKDWHRQGRWTFSAGRNHDERLGIKRYSKYTVNPKKLGLYDRRVRGQLISMPLPKSSPELYNQ